MPREAEKLHRERKKSSQSRVKSEQMRAVENEEKKRGKKEKESVLLEKRQEKNIERERENAIQKNAQKAQNRLRGIDVAKKRDRENAKNKKHIHNGKSAQKRCCLCRKESHRRDWQKRIKRLFPRDERQKRENKNRNIWNALEQKTKVCR